MLISFGLSLLASFIGSFVCFVLWMHFHFDDLWTEHHARIELERQQKKLAKMTAEERLKLEGRYNDRN
jgi:hypothetical protein